MPARLAFSMMVDMIQRNSDRRRESDDAEVRRNQEDIDWALREPGAEDRKQADRRAAIEQMGGEIG